MLAFYMENGLYFIVRPVGNRHLLDWGGNRKVVAEDLANQRFLRYEDSVLFRSHDKVRNVRVQCRSLPVRLPERPETLLHLVVAKWPKGDRRMMLLTTEKAVCARGALREVVQGYLARWRTEETIRYVKQSYYLEHMRFLDCRRLKNMAALAAAAHFAERLERSGNRRSPRGPDGGWSSASPPGTWPRHLVACSKSPSSSTAPSRTA